MSKDTRIDKATRMGEMPVGRLILAMSWPAMLSMMIQAMYNVIDSFFVARLGEQALAAITYANPIQFLMIAVGVGTGVGINSLIARRLGAELYDDANLAASHGYRLGIYNWFFFVLLGLFVAKPFMHFMTDTPYILDSGIVYLQIVTIGSLFINVQVVSEKILQATGNMVIPMICSLSGAISNVILDPLFIFGIGPFPEWGIKGAAVATVLGQVVSCALGQVLLFGGKHPVSVKLWGWKWNGRIVRDIYAVGGPAIIMQSIMSILQFGMNFILGGMTETAVAINGIYGRIQSFVFMPVFGLNQGVLPILGFNYGARNRKRFMETFKKGLTIAMAIMVVGFIIFQVFPHQILEIFNSQQNEAMYEIGVPAMRIISICFMPAAFGIMTSCVFQGSGHGFISMWGSLIRQIFGILPLAFIFSKFMTLNWVWASYPFAEILGVGYAAIMFRWLWMKELRYMGRDRERLGNREIVFKKK